MSERIVRTKLHLRLVEDDGPPCPHLHIERRYERLPDSEFSMGYREYDHCHDCSGEVPMPIITWTTA